MIRFGPAGIPLSCKGRTLIDGVEDVHMLGLTAMELQLVRMNVIERFPMEEEIGLTPREVEADLVVEMLVGEEEIPSTDLSRTIEEGDTLLTMVSGIAQNHKELNFVDLLSNQLDIVMSLHAPYYMDLTGKGDLSLQCLESLKWGGLIGNEMGARTIVTHLGLYEDKTPDEAYENVLDNLMDLLGFYNDNGIEISVGLETSGRQEVFGSLEEIMNLADEVDGVRPVINIPHIHSRQNGSLMTKEDFADLFESIEPYKKENHYVHFSGVEHEEGNEIRYTPIKKGDLRFEPFAEAIIENMYDIVLISGSPLLEHDAMYMRVIFERNYTRHIAKKRREAMKKAKKGEEEKEGGDEPEEETPEEKRERVLEEKGLDEMLKRELYEYAKLKGIHVTTKMVKDELIKRIEEGEEEEEELSPEEKRIRELEEIGIDEMLKRELYEYAKLKGIHVTTKMVKDKLIEKIEENQ